MSTEPKTIRRFRHVDGFLDLSDYLESDGENTVIVRKDGSRNDMAHITECYPLEWMEQAVKRGEWEEIKVPVPAPKYPRPIYYVTHPDGSFTVADPQP